MRKVFGFFLIIVGLITMVKALSTTSSGLEAIGAIIGVSIFTFLPSYFLLRGNKSK